MTECPKLTELTATTVVITKSLLDDLIVSTYSRTVGTAVNVSCREGFTLVGPATVTCQTSGSWSGSPYCTDNPGGVSTTTAEDRSMVLIIVLLVVSALVAALIIFVCFAILWGKTRQKKVKYYSGADDVTEYSYSVRKEKLNPVQRAFTPPHSPPLLQASAPLPPPPPVPYMSPDHQRRYVRHRYPYPHYYTRERVFEYEPSAAVKHNRYYSTKIHSMRHARSLDDLQHDGETEYPSADLYEDKVFRDRRRDGYLWRRLSVSDWNIPRPHYDGNVRSSAAEY